jgi:hypothetical protein
MIFNEKSRGLGLCGIAARIPTLCNLDKIASRQIVQL